MAIETKEAKSSRLYNNKYCEFTSDIIYNAETEPAPASASAQRLTLHDGAVHLSEIFIARKRKPCKNWAKWMSRISNLGRAR